MRRQRRANAKHKKPERNYNQFIQLLRNSFQFVWKFIFRLVFGERRHFDSTRQTVNGAFAS